MFEDYYEQAMQLYTGALPKVYETIEFAQEIYENGVLSKLDLNKIVPKPVISWGKQVFEASKISDWAYWS